jgi:hypothetical protein
LEFLSGWIPEGQLGHSGLIVCPHELHHHSKDGVVYGALSAYHAFLLTEIVQQDFGAQESELPKLQQHKTPSPVHKHLVNILGFQLRQSVKAVFADPF